MLDSKLLRDQVSHKGESLYRKLRPEIEAGNNGRFLVMDVDSGDYEIDDEDLQASMRLLARRPKASLYGVRIGHRAAYQL